jgi:ATP-dependent DNA ligase
MAYELKLDGYRAIAFKRDGVVHLRSRNDNDFNGRYPGVVKGLAKMPDNTVIDGEVIAFDDDVSECPFANLPEARSGRWGQGLTKAKMAECRWLKPVLVGQFEFLEWTADNHLRHSKFVDLREDKIARDVVRE